MSKMLESMKNPSSSNIFCSNRRCSKISNSNRRCSKISLESIQLSDKCNHKSDNLRCFSSLKFRCCFAQK